MSDAAKIILEQMGGANKIMAMLGVKLFIYSPDSVEFKFKGSRIANICKVRLLPSDTYAMEFYKYYAKDCRVELVAAYNSVYAEDLRRKFTGFTGLDLTL